MENDLYTIAELAEKLGLREPYVKNAYPVICKKREIEVVKTYGRVLFTRESVDKVAKSIKTP